MESTSWTRTNDARRHFIGGSDARIIMGDDEAALIRIAALATALAKAQTSLPILRSR